MQLSINNRRTFLNFINDPTFYIFGDIFLATRVLKLNSVYTSFLKESLKSLFNTSFLCRYIFIRFDSYIFVFDFIC